MYPGRPTDVHEAGPMTTPVITQICLHIDASTRSLRHRRTVAATTGTTNCCITNVCHRGTSNTHTSQPRLLHVVNSLRPNRIIVTRGVSHVDHLPLPRTRHLITSVRTGNTHLTIPNIISLSSLTTRTRNITGVILRTIRVVLFHLTLRVTHSSCRSEHRHRHRNVRLTHRTKQCGNHHTSPGHHTRIITLHGSNCDVGGATRLTKCDTTRIGQV